jgi:protein gp37
LKWNRKAAEQAILAQGLRNCAALAVSPSAQRDADLYGHPRRPRVFCASLADWLDPNVPVEWLADLLRLWFACQNLDILALTKRPELWRERIELACGLAGEKAETDKNWSDWSDTWCILFDWLHGNPPANVWIGATVENQEMADKRIPELLKIPARVRFLSVEPMLGQVVCEDVMRRYGCGCRCHHSNDKNDLCGDGGIIEFPAIHWVICGGESGPHARPMHPDWARSLRDQCKAAGVPFFFKQWGAYWPDEPCGCFRKIKKSNPAGRLLDGVEHNEFPFSPSAQKFPPTPTASTPKGAPRKRAGAAGSSDAPDECAGGDTSFIKGGEKC